MNLLEYFLTWPFLVITILASLFYGLFAVNIFFPKDKVKETKSEHFSWKAHQFWLNFVGSLVGWIVLYYLLKRATVLSGNNYLYMLSIRDIVSMFVAFIGVTGYLPMTVVGLVNSIALLAQKVIEIISKYVGK